MKIDMEFARRDDCLEKMVPSDLRVLLGRLERAESAQEDYVRQLEDEIRENQRLRRACEYTAFYALDNVCEDVRNVSLAALKEMNNMELNEGTQE